MKILSLLLSLSMLPVLASAQTTANTSLAGQVPDDSCVELTPASYDFGDEPVGFSTSAEPFYLLNGCSVNLIVTSVNATGQSFSQTNDCTGGPIMPQSYCTIPTTFTPTSTGEHNQQLIVTDHKQGNGQQLQQTSSLAGTGIHDAAITPTSCSFGGVQIGNEAFCTVTIKNNEPTRLTINGCQASPNPPFSEETSCPDSLAKKGENGDSVNITLDFSPYGTGLYSGQFAVTTNSPEEGQNGNPYTIPLTGVGLPVCHPPQCCNG